MFEVVLSAKFHVVVVVLVMIEDLVITVGLLLLLCPRDRRCIGGIGDVGICPSVCLFHALQKRYVLGI